MRAHSSRTPRRHREPRIAADARAIGGLLAACLREPQATAVPGLLQRHPELLAQPGLIEAALFHRIEPLVSVKATALPAARSLPVTRTLRRTWELQLMRHLRNLAHLQRVGAALDDAGIAWVVLKGAALAEWAYPRPDLRSYYDIDLLVAPAQVELAASVLEHHGARMIAPEWQRWRRRAYSQVEFLLPDGARIDLHWHLVNDGLARRSVTLPTAAVLDRLQRVAAGPSSLPVPGRADMLVHVCLHASLASANRLGWLQDIHHLVRRTPPDWDEFVNRARGAGAATMSSLLLARTSAVVGVELPAGLLKQLGGSAAWLATMRRWDAVRPPEASYGQRLMGRTVVAATRAGTADSVRALASTLVRDAVPATATIAVRRSRGLPADAGPRPVVLIDPGDAWSHRQLREAAARP